MAEMPRRGVQAPGWRRCAADGPSAASPWRRRRGPTGKDCACAGPPLPPRRGPRRRGWPRHCLGTGGPRRCLMGTAGDPCSLPTRVTLTRDIPARPQPCHARVTPSRDIPERPQPCHPRISPAMTSPHMPSRAITVSPPAVPPTAPAVPGVPRSGAVTPCPGSRRAAGLSPGRGLEAPGAPERSAPLTPAREPRFPRAGLSFPKGFTAAVSPRAHPVSPRPVLSRPVWGFEPPGANGAAPGEGDTSRTRRAPGTRSRAGGSRRGGGTPGAPGLIAVPSAGALSPCAAEEPPRRAGDWSAKNAALISELIFTPSLRPICRDLPAMRSAGPGRGSAAVPAAPRYGRRGGRGARGYPGGRRAVPGGTRLSRGSRGCLGGTGMPGTGALSQRCPRRRLNRVRARPGLSDSQLVPDRAERRTGGIEGCTARSCPVSSWGFAAVSSPPFLPFGGTMDGAGAKLPQGDPKDAATIAASPRPVPRSRSCPCWPGRAAGAVAVAVRASAAADHSSCTSRLGNGKASAWLNGLDLSRQPPRLLPHPSAPASPFLGKPQP